MLTSESKQSFFGFDPQMENTRGMNALQVSAGFGYIPDANEQQALQDIDNKLKALLPAEDFERISTTPSQVGTVHHKIMGQFHRAA